MGPSSNRRGSASVIEVSSNSASVSDQEEEQEQDSELNDEEDEEEEEEGSDDSSEDEYQPPSESQVPKSRFSKIKSKRKRGQESPEEDDDDEEDEEEEDQDAMLELDSDLEELTGKKKTRPNRPSSSTKKSKSSHSGLSQSKESSSIASRSRNGSNSGEKKRSKGQGKSKANDDDDDLISDEDQEPSFFDQQLAEMDESDPEDRLEDEIRAQEAWAAIRAKKQGKPIPPSTSKPSNDPNSGSNPETSKGNTLTSWLGLPDENSIPWPTTCAAAQIKDRDSTFISYVYPLTKLKDLDLILNHLSRKVHPTVPIDSLPPQFQSVPSNKRGSSHDMYAYSFLVLKRGRDGKEGPDDYTLQEGREDDGEKWGSLRIEKVIKQEGASDLVCIVSRWYGGTMLGPDRFNHIENVARAAIRRFIENETVEPLRQQLCEMDERISQLRKTLNPDSNPLTDPKKSNAYSDLSVERAEKLIKARNATISYLEKRMASTSKPAAPSPVQDQDQSTRAKADDQSIGTAMGMGMGVGSGVVIAQGGGFQENVKDQVNHPDPSEAVVNVDGVLRKEKDL